MKNLTKLTLSVAAASLVGTLLAEPYRFELNADYVTGSIDIDADDFHVDDDNWSFAGTYYFSPVTTGDSPLREAAFVGRNSFVSARASIADLEDDINNLVDTDGWGFEGVWIEPESGWYGGIGYVWTDLGRADRAVANFLKPEYDGYSGRVGKYVGLNTTLELGYNFFDSDSSSVGIDFGALETESVGLGVRHLGRMSETWSFGLEASYYLVDLKYVGMPDPDSENLFDNDGDVYSARATFYPASNFGFGLSYVQSDDLLGMPYLASVGPQTDGLGLFADWFINERFSLGLAYANHEYDIESDDNLQSPSKVEEDSVTFKAGYRF